MKDPIQDRKIKTAIDAVKMNKQDKELVLEISSEYSKLLHAVGKL